MTILISSFCSIVSAAVIVSAKGCCRL